ncbi:MAG: molybdopterin molybdotransferase MoeA [Phycisphaerae bacterium]
MSSSTNTPPPKFAGPQAAIDAMLPRTRRVTESEILPIADADGRVLADPLTTDRDSPPCDVTAMDGYAVRSAEMSRGVLPVRGEVEIGREPPPLPVGAALRIFTGGAIPPGCDAVIQREHVEESANEIRLRPGCDAPPIGANIRRRGENLSAGASVLRAGACVTPAVVGGFASFGVPRVRVWRRVRVAIIVTGNELLPIDAPASDWQIRDSNGPLLAALLRRHAFVEIVSQERIADDPAAIESALASALQRADSVLLTGGVSAGDHDYVPDVVRRVGGEVLFHRLPMRPGGPVLGAITATGQAIFGLPGNPLSTAVTARRIALPMLRHIAGMHTPLDQATMVTFDPYDGKSLHLWWYRLARLSGDGEAEIVVTKGSGDVVSLARSDGFVEIPPECDEAGPWAYFGW